LLLIIVLVLDEKKGNISNNHLSSNALEDVTFYLENELVV